MRSVDKHTRASIEEAQDKIREYAAAVSSAHEEASEKLEDLLTPLREALSAYNEAVADYNEILDGVIGEISDYTADRSDKWREGERGQAYEAWKANLEELKIEQVGEIDDIAIEMPDVVEPNEQPGFSIDDYA